MTRLTFRRDLLPFLIATIGEFVALYWWLSYRDAGDLLRANIVLWAGFAVERLAVAWWVRFVFNLDSRSANSPLWVTGLFLLVITGVEVGIWDLWLHQARASGPFVGFLVLLLTIHTLHFLEMAAVRKSSLFAFALNLRTAFFSLMEALGGFAWLYFWDRGNHLAGAIALLVGLTTEHLIQGGQLKPPVPARPA